MRIQILSDLHLDFNEVKELKVDGDILILAGDVGDPYQDSYWNFIYDCSAKWKHIVLVAGNHEYYGSHSMEEVDAHIHNKCKQMINVYFLQKERIVVEGTSIAGCTMWSDISSLPYSRLKYINDFKQIRKLSKPRYQKLYEDHLAYLQSLKKVDIIVTHHVPRTDLSTKYGSSPNNRFFSSDATLPSCAQPRLWVHGHSHDQYQVCKGKTLFVNCSWGYDDEREELPHNSFTVTL